jgi:hypothetical protein
MLQISSKSGEMTNAYYEYKENYCNAGSQIFFLHVFLLERIDMTSGNIFVKEKENIFVTK